MYTSMYTYPWDVQDETPRAFCSNIRKLCGVNTVSLAVSYHAAKLLLPHNPRRKVYYPEDGAVFFRPDPAAFARSVIKPHVSTLAQGEDILAALCTIAKEEGIGIIAWTVCLHNTRLGMTYPQYTPRNAFGDPAITYLCPAHREVRTYISALVSDLAQRYPLQAIQLEAVQHMPFVHGFHHEMQQMTITPALQVLLELCFCPACLALAHEHNVDGERVRQYVISEIERRLHVGGGENTEDAWRSNYWDAALDGELARYFALRYVSVARLLTEVYQAAHAVSTVPIHVQDGSLMGATPHLSTHDLTWRSGLPPAEKTADGVTALGYIAGIERFQEALDAYSTYHLPTLPLEIGLRPAAPDCASVEELMAKVAYCVQKRVAGISFYNYGMLPEPNMQWIKTALSHSNT